MALLVLIIAATAALLAVDTGCYLWLRANEARRTLPIRHVLGRRKPQVGAA